MLFEILAVLAITALFAGACMVFGTVATVGVLFSAIAGFVAVAHIRTRRKDPPD